MRSGDEPTLMRRIVTALLLAAIVLIALAITAARDEEDETYRVRAIFDNVSAAVGGEDVRVAGATVGRIESMDVTEDHKAAVVLSIDDTKFAPFRRDARCTIRPQSLIGEKYVECDPGTYGAPKLAEIEEGDGAGQHLLPLARTSSPVDLDLINNIMRLPYRERFSILISELGAGLAGRGDDLDALIRRANPALRETDRVLAILARQNGVLERLAADSDTSLAPLAREKERLTSFIRNANATGQATAERRDEMEASIRRLPGFLRELRPLMADLNGFAVQGTPVAADLRTAGADVSRLIRAMGPFSRGALPALQTLGDAARTGRPALLRTRPLIRDLASFAQVARPVSTNLDRFTASFDRTGGIERFADYLFFQTLAVNGFDGLGHYLRAGLIVNLCSLYAIRPAAGCSANFTQGSTAAAARSKDRPDLGPRLAEMPELAREGEAGQGERAPEGSVPAGGTPEARRLAEEIRKRGNETIENIRKRADEGSPALDEVSDPLLDYLLGGTP
jgi:phospholipid/cholesterol/gamma-HCH transport system substrate-binding protein